jgi:hypothetical protein
MTVIHTSDVRAVSNELREDRSHWLMAYRVMLLTYIWEVLGLKFLRDTDSHAAVVFVGFSVPPDKCSDSTLK